MQIEVDHCSKTVYFWLTKAEAGDASSLKLIFGECSRHKYRAVVFKSGAENLADVTSALLCCNRCT